MDDNRYLLGVPGGEPRRLTVGWLYLALGSLILGGVLTILIVLSRTPGVQDLMPWKDFFHTAIVVHVDQTVLVWFLAFAGVFWSLNSAPRAARWNRAALYLCVAGTAVFTVAPFVGAGDPLMNNYIPVLQDPVFLAGLGLVGIGFAVLVASALFGSRPLGDLAQGGAALRVGLQSALLAALVALAALAATYWGMPARMSGRVYYELLFWGGGHVLQFTHTLLMLVAWLWLAAACGVTLRIAPRLVAALFALGALPVLAAPLVYVFYAVDDPGHVTAFTDLMKYGNALAALPLGLLVVLAVIRAPRAVLLRGPEGTALLFSMLLFAAGGVIGYLISGINVTIPAHYHGSIVAVTIAFMGVTYHLLPRLGFAAPMPRLARLQPAIYGGGQLLHVLGLAWSGGYGVQRKTAGAEQGLDSLAEIAGMAVMGIGGLIAVIGGLLFLVVAIKAIWWKSRSA